MKKTPKTIKRQHILVEDEYHQKIQKMAKKRGISIKEITQRMINYSDITGFDPNNVDRDESIQAVQILIGFMMDKFEWLEKKITFLTEAVSEKDKDKSAQIFILQKQMSEQMNAFFTGYLGASKYKQEAEIQNPEYKEASE